MIASNTAIWGKWVVLCLATYAYFHLDGVGSWLMLAGMFVLFLVAMQLQTFFNVLLATRIFFVDQPAMQAWLSADRSP